MSSRPDDTTDCGGSDPVTVTADTQGRFSTAITVARILNLATGAIDCSFADPVCEIAAGEIVDFPRTVATAPLDVVGPGRPDVVIRQFGGTALTGDNVYNTTGFGRIAPSTRGTGRGMVVPSASRTMATRTRWW